MTHRQRVVLALGLFLFLALIAVVVLALAAALVAQGGLPFLGERVALLRVEGRIMDTTRQVELVRQYRQDPRIRAIVGIGLPLDLYNFEYLIDYSNPSLYIVGTRDEFCSPMNLENLIRRLPFASKVHRIQGADHFFSEQIEEVEQLIEQFFRGLLPDQAMP